jgi:hypothetical protein
MSNTVEGLAETDCGAYLAAYQAAYGNKTVSFRFRGQDLRFTLSQGLFSSMDIDRGTRVLLKVFSRLLDEAGGRPFPRRVLDSGCGIGVIGICAARALSQAAGTGAAEAPLVRCQDRDELARIFTQANAADNGLAALRAYTEPLLSGDPGGGWDLILSNIPAKAGEPVLEDFIRRSPGLLAPGGRVIIVVVNTLADFFRDRISRCGASLTGEERGPEHTVLVYEAGPAGVPPGGPAPTGGGVYLRQSGHYEMEGIGYDIGAVHGAAEFDRPGEGAVVMAKLLCRLGAGSFGGTGGLDSPVLIHEGGQGHFPLWFLRFLERAAPEQGPAPLLLHGRNILALEAARDNILAGGPTIDLRILPGVDPWLDRERILAALGAGGFGCIAAFPQAVPQTNRQDSLWEALGGLLLPGGLALAALPAAEAERLDRRKPPGFTRLGDLKRRGFRALAYRWTGAGGRT